MVLRVFARGPGEGGNALGVVLDGASVPEPERQSVATSLGYAETVFVDDAQSGRIRIFTPAEELPFAGHPTVGTAWLLHREGHPVDAVRTAAGDAAAEVSDEGARIRAEPQWAPPFELVELGSPEEVDALTGPPRGLGAVSAWAWLDEAEGLIRARVFVPELGIAEDEATGAAALRLCARLSRAIEIRQGRASVIHAKPADEGQVEIGGLVHLEGTRELPRSGDRETAGRDITG